MILILSLVYSNSNVQPQNMEQLLETIQAILKMLIKWMIQHP